MTAPNHIVELRASDIGRWVVYHGAGGEIERGRLKWFDREQRRAHVVYGRAAETEDWQVKTAAATSYYDLTFAEEKQ